MILPIYLVCMVGISLADKTDAVSPTTTASFTTIVTAATAAAAATAATVTATIH